MNLESIRGNAVTFIAYDDIPEQTGKVVNLSRAVRVPPSGLLTSLLFRAEVLHEALLPMGFTMPKARMS